MALTTLKPRIGQRVVSKRQMHNFNVLRACNEESFCIFDMVPSNNPIGIVEAQAAYDLCHLVKDPAQKEACYLTMGVHQDHTETYLEIVKKLEKQWQNSNQTILQKLWDRFLQSSTIITIYITHF
jgi:hypothetical protein